MLYNSKKLNKFIDMYQYIIIEELFILDKLKPTQYNIVVYFCICAK